MGLGVVEMMCRHGSLLSKVHFSSDQRSNFPYSSRYTLLLRARFSGARMLSKATTIRPSTNQAAQMGPASVSGNDGAGINCASIGKVNTMNGINGRGRSHGRDRLE